jgi:hypothetical protein
LFFVATKTDASTVDKIPVQSWYAREFAAAQTIDRQAAGRLDAIWRRLPQWLQVFLRRSVPRLDPARRPWRLKSTNKFA